MNIAISQATYPWKRYWCARHHGYQLTYDGFLADPEGPLGSAYNPALRTFDAITMLPCLALLGEPGIGKSRAVEGELNSLEKYLPPGETILPLDLRSVGSEERLIQKIFKDRRFEEWLAGDHRLHLFLDSLDECMLRVATVAQVLVDELKACPVDRLALRIACRTAVWPAFLEASLSDLWGKEQFGAFELTPLRRQDVSLAARVEGVDPDAFLSAVGEASAAAFAIKPVTLGFLLLQYKRDGRLPASQRELYAEGCRILCEEENLSRRIPGNTRQLTALQRLAVAARIAAITVFSNKYAIYTEPDLGDVPENCVPIEALVGGTEKANDISFTVSEEAIREALDTGLFSSRGLGLIGWAHQTYAEFLAAHYFLERQLSLDQISALIMHAEEAGKKVVPQLHETAAWIATGHPDVLRSLMATEPLVILTSDVAAVDPNDRAAIVERILHHAGAEKLMYGEVPRPKLLRKLKYPDLAAQLKPYLLDKTKPEVSRYAAIDIAEACKCIDLQDNLLTISLDTTESLIICVQAACAIGRVGDAAHKDQLRPLAEGAAGDDPDDELKGYALRALWPGLCTSQELFSYLTQPKHSALVGAYASFLYQEFTQHLAPADLPIAFQWAAQHPGSFNRISQFGGAVAGILRLAWQHLDSEGVLDALAELAMARIRAFEPFFPDGPRKERPSPFFDDTAKRRKFIDALVQRVNDVEEEAHHITFADPPLFAAEDFGWLLEQASLSDQETARATYARIARRLFNGLNTAQFDALYEAAQTNPVLRAEFADFLDPVVLGSEKAQAAKRWYEQEQELVQRRNNIRPLLSPPPRERVQMHLASFEAGTISAWIALNRDLQLEPNDRYYEHDLEPDLTELPGWQAAEPETRHRIIASAESYLYEGDPQTDQWIGSNSPYLTACAGYRAFHLLFSENADALERLPRGIWSKWTAIALFYPTANGGRTWEQYQRLLPLFYRQAPQEFVSALMHLINRDNTAAQYLAVLDALDGCWDRGLADALVKKAEEPAITPLTLSHILCTVLKKDGSENEAPYGQAVNLAVYTVNEYQTTGGGRERALVAAEALLAYRPQEGWAAVWPLIENQADFGRALFENLAYKEQHSSQLLTRMSADRLGRLYHWLVEQYPYKDDPQYTTMEAHFVGPDESVRHWRNNVLQALQQRGTQEACLALARLVSELPDLAFLPSILRQARDLTLRLSWEPPSPQAILRIAQDSDARLVRNGDDLLRVIKESLDRLQRKLQGETYAAPFLWDRVPKRGNTNIYRPKDENSLSDFVKLHLEDDLKGRGIVADREVQIRRGRGNAPGELTDIHVDAIALPYDTTTYQKVTVIIETKGCWNKELLTAMETQLVERYLKDNNCQHGLYLVGWYDCPQWDSGDDRKKDVPAKTLDELRTELAQQAAQLSQGGLTILAYILDASLR